MSSKWTTQNAASSGLRPSPEDLDKSIVLLLYGKNSFGDKIYSYLKITIGGLENLRNAILSGDKFNPSDFGTVIAAGKDEPTDDVKAEINSMYQVMNAQPLQAEPVKAAPPIQEKKAWDEY